jgi:hypothetical protein
MGERGKAVVGEDEVVVEFEVGAEFGARVAPGGSGFCGEPNGGCVAPLFAASCMWIVDGVEACGG